MSDVCLIDANVVIDVVADDPNHADWSKRTLFDLRRARARVVCNPVVVAETSRNFVSQQEQMDFFSSLDMETCDLPVLAGYTAGLAHTLYRRRGGKRAVTLPDFFIGAHALVENLTLVTRDHRRFSAYFPTVTLISPETHPA
jgi:predicted nucleic acid-binding protein